MEPQPQTGAREAQWTTQNCVALELPTVRLRDFSMTGEGTPTLLCAPFALHGSTITDFAPGHSLVAALQGAGMRRVFVTDWRSASPDMRFLSIDNYLADLNVLVDELGSRVNLLGLCQGGWMALIYAARFPGKVARLALAGAPIDLAAGKSKLSELAHDTPIPIFRELVALGGGRILGQHALQFWAPSFPDPEEVRALLQSPHAAGSTAFRRLESRFRDWYASTLDLPGTYYLQVVEHLFKHNHLSTGRFVALSRKVDLSKLRCPLFLLAAGDDDVVAPAQIFATEHLVDPRCSIEKAVAPCGHLGLFMGKEILARIWPEIARWLSPLTLDGLDVEGSKNTPCPWI
ncbi:MAG: alpha/beta fold hydrolase [Hyphomicrobiales bacterium]|nr:alpha/beta fold hydrolase [Hyphomicrobiales bacterium]